jgi:iron uptake system component EfeO
MQFSKMLAALTATIVIASVGCTSKDSGADTDAIKVRSTDDACEVSAQEAPSGNLVFDVSNDGTQATEFYLLAADGVKVLGEVENIGPGISRKMIVKAEPGDYIAACKPGMVGDGIRSAFTVT